MNNSNEIPLIFIINGQEVLLSANAHAVLRAAVQRALAESGNTGRPADEWELRDASGALVDIDSSPAALRLTPGARLFLSLQVGAGGNARRS